MEREGEEEEAAADHSQGLAIHSAWRYWCMLDLEQALGMLGRAN